MIFMSNPVSGGSATNDAYSCEDEHGLQSWINECDWMEGLGAYKTLANMVRLQKNKVFMDICSGTCPLELHFMKEHQGIHVLALEANRHSNRHAMKRLQECGIGSHIALASSGEEILCEGPDTNKEPHVRTWHSLQDEVTIVPMNIDDLAGVGKFLGSWRASLSAFTFNGLSPKELAKRQIPYNDPDNPAFQQAKGDNIRSAFALATAFTVPGGKLLRAERMTIEDPRQDLHETQSSLYTEFMNQLGKYWKLSNFRISPQCPPAFVATMLLGHTQQTRHIVNAVLLRRNNVPCDIHDAKHFVADIRADYI